MRLALSGKTWFLKCFLVFTLTTCAITAFVKSAVTLQVGSSQTVHLQTIAAAATAAPAAPVVAATDPAAPDSTIFVVAGLGYAAAFLLCMYMQPPLGSQEEKQSLIK